MRLRILIIVIVTLVVLSVAANYWPFGPSSYETPRSFGLVVDFVRYAEPNAVIHVKSTSHQTVQLEPWVEIAYRDEAADIVHPVTNTVLSPGAMLAVRFPAPTIHVYWRAGVLGYTPWQHKCM